MNSSKTENSASRSLSDFGEHTEHFLFTTPIKMDYQVYWFPEEVSNSPSALSWFTAYYIKVILKNGNLITHLVTIRHKF